MNIEAGRLAADGDQRVTSLSVGGLHCANCIAKVERALLASPGVISARVNFTTHKVTVRHDLDVDPDTLRQAISGLGFEAAVFAGELQGKAGRENRQLIKALAVAGFAAMNVMLLSVSNWSGADGATRAMFHWISALIALPAIAYAGRPFFASAWRALRSGRTNMDVPISIGVVLACSLSLYETASGGRDAYFDGAVMLLFFLLAGRVLDTAVRARAEDGVAALMRLTVQRALVLGEGGQGRWQEAATLHRGLRIQVAAGERIAADGTIVSGHSQLDRGLVTGEATPEAVGPGDVVLAGVLNLGAPLVVEVTAAGDDTAIADMARVMEAASQSKSRYIRIADRAARLYAPAVHSLAFLSFCGWMLVGAGWHQSILVAVTVLIVTCPCALGLAVPVAQVVATGGLMRRGVLVKDGSALERLAQVDRVCFDKTGTLTLGRPTPVGVPTLELDADADLALALAQSSRHPLSRALSEALLRSGTLPAPLELIGEQPGLGVEGEVDGQRVRLGRTGWVGGCDGDAPADQLLLAFRVGSEPARLLRFADRPRPHVGEAVTALNRLGIQGRILSGDRIEAVAQMAHQLGLDASAEQTPAMKVDTIETERRRGHRILMVGDGLNDGPALKAADVSIAPSSASDVGQNAADIVFVGDDLIAVPLAVRTARATLAIVKQNLVLAILYNIVAVPVAMLGLATPLIAAAAMSGSSILVVANALRLKWKIR